MKIAISLPPDVLEEAEQLARNTRRPRSQVVRDALRGYLARHSPDEVTDALDRAVAAAGEPVDPFVARAAKRTLEQSEW